MIIYLYFYDFIKIYLYFYDLSQRWILVRIQMIKGHKLIRFIIKKLEVELTKIFLYM